MLHYMKIAAENTEQRKENQKFWVILIGKSQQRPHWEGDILSKDLKGG